MARTTQEYYDLLIAEKESMSSLWALQPNINENSQSLLDDLTTTSKVALWRLMVWLFAYGLSINETVLEIYADSTESGTPRWYQKKASQFQYGDPLVIVNNAPQYAAVNESNQIIKLVAVVEALDGRVILKVSKLDGSGEPEPLTTGEKTAFESYMYAVKFAGTRTTVISQAADDMMLAMKVTYDALVLNSDGSRIDDATIFPVNDAVDAFLKNLTYNGILYLDELTAAVRTAFGVVHATIIAAKGKPFYASAVDYVDIVVDADQKYNPEAGYLRISTTPGETLADLIQYQPS